MAFKKNNAVGGNYKVKGLKIFGSKENLYFNVKKYRKVFDESESRYIYCEIAFYNKLFDEADWDCKLKYVCKNIKTRKEICSFEKEFSVKKDQNIVYIREGWGTPDPGWWKIGKYEWEVSIDGKAAGKCPFYIVKGGEVTGETNPYFNIKQIQLFESPKKGTPFNDRTYYNAFSSKETKYLNIEMRLENHRTSDASFPLELQFNFYNDTGQHKAFMSYFKEFTDKRKEIIMDTGYGSDNGGYWYPDKYTLEVVFMDNLIAVVPFEVGDEFIEQDGPHPFSTTKQAARNETVTAENKPKMTFDEAVEELNGLIGLKSVKEQLHEFASYLQFLKVRKEKGIEESSMFNLHSIFMGNPGTGKTTVAKMLGQIYHSLGLLSKDTVHEVGRVDLVGEYIGQTAPRVKKAIDKARGGILFIDEAYALTNRGDDSKDFGQEVIEVLIKEMSDGPGDLAIICAGYPKEMQNFLNSNPGMSSRIRNIFLFPDYNPDELMEIAVYRADKSGIIINDPAKAYMHKKVVEAYRNRNEHFGNARYVNGVVEEAKQNMALRLMKQYKNLKRLSKDKLSTINQTDVQKVFRKGEQNGVTLPIDEALYDDTLKQLHELVGLENIKREVMETAKLVKYYREIGKDIKTSFSLHTVFKGNPGTGKTTVARLIVQIYKALGILERGHVLEVDRKDLVAGFSGQTAIKTGEVIEQALGGGLFIDEAYALTQGGTSDGFGREAVETLLKGMEDKRGQFMVIVAGYPEEMQQFLEANPGLMSRFDKQFVFEDYSAEELLDIAKMMFDTDDLKMNEEAEQHLKEYIANLLEKKHKYFGNARTIRKIVAEAIKRQNLRMADIPSSKRSEELIATIIKEDVSEFSMMEEDDNEQKTIGFGR